MRSAPLRALFRREKVLGHVDEPMLSVFREHGVIPKDEATNLNKTAEDRSIYQLVEPGWLVVNRMKAWQGSVGISPYRGIVSGHYICFRPRHSEHDQYLNWLLRSAPMTARFGAISRGVRTGQIEIDNDDLASTMVPLPPFDEQRRIADFLDDQVVRIERIVNARDQQEELLSDGQERGVVDTVLAGGNLTGKASLPFINLPSHWTVQRLANVWSVIDCKHRTPSYVESGYPVVSPGDVRPGRLDLSACQRFVSDLDYADLADDMRRCRAGDLVYSRNASVGAAALVQPGQLFTMGQDVCRITSTEASQSYLGHVLNFAVGPQLDALRIGSTFTRINIAAIKSLQVPVPPLDEQAALADAVWGVLDGWAATRQRLQRSVELLGEYKRSLITAAVTGELDVTTARTGVSA